MPETEAISTRDRILDAAWTLAVEEGVGAASMNGVARAVGLSRQAVYLHFPNRATLLAETARRHDERSGFGGRVVAARALPPVEALAALIGEWFAYVPQIAPVARGLLAAFEAGDEGGTAFSERMADLRRVLHAAVERIAEAGRLRDGWTVDEATDWVWSRVHFTTWRHLVDERGWSAELALERTLRSLASDLIV
ncbi:MAG: TetR/AcrR family transcriptional regulator [Vicinamibacterales bacterium]